MVTGIVIPGAIMMMMIRMIKKKAPKKSFLNRTEINPIGKRTSIENFNDLKIQVG